MLGRDLTAELTSRAHQWEAPASAEANVTDPTQVAEWIGKTWDWVVNCAAYTAVDKAETDSDQAMLVNGIGAGYVARACAMYGVKLLHIGSDFVFDGSKKTPYEESDPPNPLGAYGRSKRQGEETVLGSGAQALLVRTAWLFGPYGASFPRTILRAARAGKPLRVVADQTGSPTYTGDLARTLVDLIERNAFPGIYHAAGPEAMTWCDLARKTVCAAGLDVSVEPIATEDWPTPSRRPQYSVLGGQKVHDIGIAPMRPIDDALREFVQRLDAAETV